jgi:uncharacterized protein
MSSVGANEAAGESEIPSKIKEIRQARSELAVLCVRHNVRRLELFGLAVGTDFDRATDSLDFLVEFGPFPNGGYSEHYLGLLDDLTALFARPVDLLVARAVRNPFLLENIYQTRELLYACHVRNLNYEPAAKSSSTTQGAEAVCGLRPFPVRGAIVTNELIRKLRDEEDD